MCFVAKQDTPQRHSDHISQSAQHQPIGHSVCVQRPFCRLIVEAESSETAEYVGFLPTHSYRLLLFELGQSIPLEFGVLITHDSHFYNNNIKMNINSHPRIALYSQKQKLPTIDASFSAHQKSYLSNFSHKLLNNDQPYQNSHSNGAFSARNSVGSAYSEYVKSQIQKKDSSQSKQVKRKKNLSEISLPQKALRKQPIAINQAYSGTVLSNRASPKSEIYKSFDAAIGKKVQKSPTMLRVSKAKLSSPLSVLVTIDQSNPNPLQEALLYLNSKQEKVTSSVLHEQLCQYYKEQLQIQNNQLITQLALLTSKVQELEISLHQKQINSSNAKKERKGTNLGKKSHQKTQGRLSLHHQVRLDNSEEGMDNLSVRTKHIEAQVKQELNLLREQQQINHHRNVQYPPVTHQTVLSPPKTYLNFDTNSSPRENNNRIYDSSSSSSSNQSVKNIRQIIISETYSTRNQQKSTKGNIYMDSLERKDTQPRHKRNMTACETSQQGLLKGGMAHYQNQKSHVNLHNLITYKLQDEENDDCDDGDMSPSNIKEATIKRINIQSLNLRVKKD